MCGCQATSKLEAMARSTATHSIAGYASIASIVINKRHHGSHWRSQLQAALLFACLLTLLQAKAVRADEDHGTHTIADTESKLHGPPVVDLTAPPMGFMSWERFRCDIECTTDGDKPIDCVHEQLYREMVDALIDHGYSKVGYTLVNVDDCWTVKPDADNKDGRDPTTKRLQADPFRFPSGMKALGDYMHDRKMHFGLYSDAGPLTCGGYSGSFNHSLLDAQTFSEWGVDYLKMDGCYIDTADNYEAAYVDFGDALKRVSQTPIAYSCSWPAYLGDDETTKPFHKMYHKAGCNTWRNWADIDNTWESLKGIIMHWADYWKPLQESLPHGAFHDADMLLGGDDHYDKLITLEQAKVQFAFWSIIASPLFIGGDVRTIPTEYARILQNRDIIDINQDPSRRMGICRVGCVAADNNTTDASPPASSLQQVWSKELNQGTSIVFGFFNLADEPFQKIEIKYSILPNMDITQCLDLWWEPVNICPHNRIGETIRSTLPSGQDVEMLSEAPGKHKITIFNMLATSNAMIRVDLVESPVVPASIQSGSTQRQ